MSCCTAAAAAAEIIRGIVCDAHAHAHFPVDEPRRDWYNSEENVPEGAADCDAAELAKKENDLVINGPAHMGI